VDPHWGLRDMMNIFLYHPGQINRENSLSVNACQYYSELAFSHFRFMRRQVKSGNHLVNPPTTVKTASTDRT
jgi:hypothetical protein